MKSNLDVWAIQHNKEETRNALKYVNKNLEMSGAVIMQLLKNHHDLDSFNFSALSPFQARFILRV